MAVLNPDAVIDAEDETAAVIRHDARTLPLDDASVDLIVTSPPYFALRSYRDDGEHYDGQIGSEDTPNEWLDALDECMVEWGRVLKPSGSVWINLGDKYAAGHGGSSTENGGVTIRKRSSFAENPRERPDLPNPPASWSNRDVTGKNVVPGFRPKSLMGLPWRFAIRQIDNGWILRAEVVWDKPNGLPESVTDRVRRSHEQWFHFVKEPRYFSGVDEIREPSLPASVKRAEHGTANRRVSPRQDATDDGWRADGMQAKESVISLNPLGRLPGSVWTIPGDEHSGDKVVVSLAAWRSVNGLCPTCGKTPTRAAGNGQAGETNAATGKAPATSNLEAKTGHTESPTGSMSDTSLTDSPSIISAETGDASTPTTSKQSPFKSTSAAGKKPTEPTASTGTPSPTPTSTGVADMNDGNVEPVISDVCECDTNGRPGSVWTVPSEPLLIPDATRELLDLPDHFAAFPQEFPRRIILGWSPTGICDECGEGRRPVVEKSYSGGKSLATDRQRANDDNQWDTFYASHGHTAELATTISSYVCACPTPDAPTTPSIVLDPMGGTGTVAGVARMLGRYGISNDLSEDYNRLAAWRIWDSDHFTKTEQRTWADRQGTLI